ncbi:MAG: hypothetical protein GF416_04985 [Candidatus Altiarchaeales archaeon]|nr:hypothetical protein [Candidatus Altiarchaeales archaeon]MBD3416472.1 hypothetical protein [Candidatus Altiarchaeales archaeon]
MRSLILVVLVLLASGCVCMGTNVEVTLSPSEEKTSGDRIYYCEWSWPQKIIEWDTKEVLYVCPARRPYCNVNSAEVGVRECCKYDTRDKSYHDCMEV